MSARGKIKRYSLIIEKLSKKGGYPSFNELKDFLISNGFEESKRTIQRDLEDIRDEFGVEITYDSSKNGYYIDEAESPKFDAFVRFLELVNTAELLKESLQTSKKTLEHISFDKDAGLKGIKHLKILLEAIRSHREITFTHYNFQKDTHKTHALKPYLLKEYTNRWYIVGAKDEVEEYRNFGVDRISDLKMTENTFIPDQDIDVAYLYNDVIGMVYSENTKEEVILSFTAMQGNYIKTLPLHHSQEILIDSPNELKVLLNLIPNYELEERIFMYNSNVKVLKPVWLAKKIKDKLIKALEQY